MVNNRPGGGAKLTHKELLRPIGQLKTKTLKAYKNYQRIILYLVFGGLTTLVNLLVYFGLTRLVGVQYLISNIAAWIAAVLFAYAGNRVFVFASSGRGLLLILKECATFIGCRMLSGLADTGIVYVMIDLLHFQDLMVKIIANTTVVILNYFLSKQIVFRDKDQGEVIG